MLDVHLRIGQQLSICLLSVCVHTLSMWSEDYYRSHSEDATTSVTF